MTPSDAGAPRILFLCWSGQRSKHVADALKHYFMHVFERAKRSDTVPRVEMSETLIAKGAPWSAQLLTNLEDAGAGIVCLTPENRRSAWLHFEGGAIATRKRRHDRETGNVESAPNDLYGFLFTIDSAQIDGPLALFQATVYRRDYERDREELARLTTAVLRRFEQCDNETGYADLLDALMGRLRELQFVAFRDMLPALEQHARRIIQAVEDLDSLPARVRALSAMLSLQSRLEHRERDMEVVCAPGQHLFLERLIETLSDSRAALERAIGEGSGKAPPLNELAAKLCRMLEVAAEPLTPVLEDAWRYALYCICGTREEAYRKQKLLLIQPLESRLQRADPEISAASGEIESFPPRSPGESVPFGHLESVPFGHLMSPLEKRRALRSYWAWDRVAAYIHYCEDVSPADKKDLRTTLLDLVRGVLKEISLLEVLPREADRDQQDMDDLPVRFALRALILKAKLATAHGAYSDPPRTAVMDKAEVREVLESRIRGETGLSFERFEDFLACLRNLNGRVGVGSTIELEPPLLRLCDDLERLLANSQTRAAGAPV